MIAYRVNHAMPKPSRAAPSIKSVKRRRRLFTMTEIRRIDELRRLGLSWRAIGDTVGREKSTARAAWWEAIGKYGDILPSDKSAA
jgi:hypothetical protein